MLTFLLVVVLFAVLVYGTTRALQRRGVQPSVRRGAKPRERTPASRPVAPDDDEDFLRDLERYRRPRPGDPES